MRLKSSKPHAEEALVAVLNEGYALLNWIQDDFSANGQRTHQHRAGKLEAWGAEVHQVLRSVFPTALEWNQFRNTPKSRGMRVAGPNTDLEYMKLIERAEDLLGALGRIIQESLPRYTDLPQTERLFVEDIDSFSNVRVSTAT